MSDVFSKEEKAAMRDYAKEKKRSKEVDGGQMLREAVAALPDSDRAMAEKVCDLIREIAPGLAPKTFYGMPAFANTAGKVVVFFQGAQKFKTRYCTVGFSDQAKLDDGPMWATGFALLEWTSEVDSKMRELVKRAVGGE